MPPPHSNSLFVFTFSHLPDVTAPSEKKRPQPSWTFKAFGFFDEIHIFELNGAIDDDMLDQSGHRHKRVLFANGNTTQVRALLDACHDKAKPAYLAISLLKLSGKIAHADYHKSVASITARDDDQTLYLPCLDAPDVLALRAFPGALDPKPNHPLATLIKWVGELRDSAPFRGEVERSLTIVACESLQVFIDKLARCEAGGDTQALLSVTDMNGGRGTQKLYENLGKLSGGETILKKLPASVGYYDFQGILPVEDAARILQAAHPLVKTHSLTTSTCFLGLQEFSPSEPPTAPATSALLKSLRDKAEKLREQFGQLERAKCLNPSARDIANEAIGKFSRLHSSGLIPGSRLLTWTCRDALNCLSRECRDHLARRQDQSNNSTQKQDAEFHRRQRDYGQFFRAICDEIDRRVSLSLPAHTRFFPCSLEAPLKIFTALDLIGRLMAASFRCYRCLDGWGPLQVFNAKSDKPTQFFSYAADGVYSDTKKPLAIMVITTFSPRMVRHFYLSLFIVLHEVAQCIIKETIAWPSFTTLVFTQALVERHAVISTLAAGDPPHAHNQPVLPGFMFRWSCDLLQRECLGIKWSTEPSRVGPEYFAEDDLDTFEHRPRENTWAAAGVWRSLVSHWKIDRVRAADDTPAAKENAALLCYQLYRDTRNYEQLERVLADESFKYIWAQELIGDFAPLKTTPPGMANESGVRPEPRYPKKVDETIRLTDSWSRTYPLSEYIELASLVPFLRLFESDTDSDALLDAVRGLIGDYLRVWDDTENPLITYEAARRFVVAIASAELFRSHLRSGAQVDCFGADAEAAIARSIHFATSALLADVEHLPPGRAKDTCLLVWREIATPSAVSDGVLPHHEQLIAQPMILKSMVRFLVRLLHIYRIEGGNVVHDKMESLKKLNRRIRRLFDARRQEGNRHIPTADLLELWALQYKLTEKSEDTDYLFNLNDAVDAAGW